MELTFPNLPPDFEWEKKRVMGYCGISTCKPTVLSYKNKDQSESVVNIQKQESVYTLRLWKYSIDKGDFDDLSIGGWEPHSRYGNLQDAINVAASLVWLGLDGTRYVTKTENGYEFHG